MSSVSRVLSLSRNRQAVRSFSDRPVPQDVITRVLDCARYASSAKEAQPWRFVVVRDALKRHQLAAAAFHNAQVRKAPVVVVGCARVHSHVSGSGYRSHPVDLAAATQAMILGAADMGLGSAWITGYRESMVRELLGIPGDVPVVTLLAFGYADGYAPLPPRRDRTDVVTWERWEAES